MTMKGKKQILVAGDSGILGNHIVSQLIAQGLHVKVSGKDWDDAPNFLQGEEGRKSPYGEHLGLGGKQTDTHDETAYLPHSESRLHDTSTGNYISADKEDTSSVDFLKDNSAIASSGGRGNAYKTAKYDPHAEDVEMGGEFRHKEWEKDEPSDAAEKKPTGKSGAGQARYATETGSYVGEFMSMYSPPVDAGQETPGHQTLTESTYDNMKASKDQVNPREHVDRGGAVDHGSSVSARPSASTGSSGSGERMRKGRDMSTGSAAYVKFDRSLDKKEHMNSVFEGVDGLLILGYSPTQDMSGTAKMLFDTAKEKGIGHVVYLSMQGASKKSGVQHLDAMSDTEQQLRNSGLSYTILRPSLYMEYFFSDKALSSIREGHLELPLSPDRPVDLVSAADVGHIVAEAFQIPKKFHGKEIDLSSDRLSMNEIASEMGKIFSKKIEYRKAEGAKGSMNDHFQWMEKNDARGDIGQSTEFMHRFNIQLTTFRDYLREMKDKVSFEKAA